MAIDPEDRSAVAKVIFDTMHPEMYGFRFPQDYMKSTVEYYEKIAEAAMIEHGKAIGS